MLTRVTLSIVVLTSGLFGTLGSMAYSNELTGCPPGSHYDGQGCVDDEPGDEDDHETGCVQREPTVAPAPCRRDGFDLVPELDRYVKALTAEENELYRPPAGRFSHLGYWTGPADEGWMYEWYKLAGWGGGIVWGAHGYMWLPDAPAGSAPVVDPEAVARGILDRMTFDPVAIGLAPRPLEQNPESIGLVGAPVWMWVTNEGPTTWGPNEESVTVGGITVTVTAHAESIVWSMGDGGSKTCPNTGQPYRESYGVRVSPTCGYTYERTSVDAPGTAFPVTATTNWSAEWSASNGAAGELDVPAVASTVRVRIGERQVVEVG